MTDTREAPPTPAAAPSSPDPSLCSKCGSAIDTTGYPVWCKACRAKYQKDYKAARAEMTESRGYAAGIAAMRAHLAGHFDRLGSGAFTGFEIAGLIRQSKGPKLAD